MQRRKFLSLLSAGSLTALAPTPGKAASANNFSGHPDAIGVLHDSVRCIGCRKCESACATVNNRPLPSQYGVPEPAFDDLSVLSSVRRTNWEKFTVVNRYDTSAGQVYRKIQCNHCQEPACVSACFVKALEKTPQGPVVYNPKLCVGCRYCMIACPYYIPTYNYTSALDPLVFKCTMCAPRIAEGKLPGCVEACPKEALIFGKRADLINIARSRIMNYPGLYVDHIYGEHEMGGANWLYLSPVPHAELGQPVLSKTSAPELTSGALGAVAMVSGLWPVFLGGAYFISKRRDKMAVEDVETSVEHAVEQTRAEDRARLEASLAKAEKDKQAAIARAATEARDEVIKALEENLVAQPDGAATENTAPGEAGPENAASGNAVPENVALVLEKMKTTTPAAAHYTPAVSAGIQSDSSATKPHTKGHGEHEANLDELAPGAQSIHNRKIFANGRLNIDFKKLLSSPGNILTIAILLAGLAVTVMRFTLGLGAVTNLDDNYPWGLWISFDLLCGVVLAAGGYATTTAYYLFGLRDFKTAVRPAIATAFLGYAFVVVALSYDVGQPWRLPFPIFLSQGTTSVLFEVGLCVFIYVCVLLVEWSVTAFEWLGWKSIRGAIVRITIPLTVFGVILSTMHQSSLGALYLISPSKMHPLWYSPFLPVFFFVSSMFAGMSMVIFEGTLAFKGLRHEMDAEHLHSADKVVFGFGKASSAIMMGYLLIRLMGIAMEDSWGHLASGYGILLLIELLGFVALPAFLYALGVRERNATLIRWTSVLTLLGVVLNRFSVSLVAFNWQLPSIDKYFPSITEIIISVFVVTLIVTAYRIFAYYLPMLREHPNHRDH